MMLALIIGTRESKKLPKELEESGTGTAVVVKAAGRGHERGQTKGKLVDDPGLELGFGYQAKEVLCASESSIHRQLRVVGHLFDCVAHPDRR
jgi:hypothetical protein